MTVIISLAACGPRSNGIQTYRIATVSVRGDAINLARFEGVLGGQSNGDGTACFWIGNGPSRTALFWPYGYKAYEPPLGVYDDNGVLVALVGQRVTMAGGRLADDVHSIVGCPGFTDFWGVGRVDSAT